MRLALALALALAPAGAPAQPCALAGNMRFVQRDADYKIYVTAFSNADVQPRLVPYQTTRPGEWRPVDVGMPVRFTVQVVASRDQADFTVRFVDFPRCP